MTSDDNDHPLIASISQSQPGVPNDKGIDYLRDVNVAAQDVINLLRDTLQTIDRALSEHPELASSEQGVDPMFQGISKPADDFLSKLRFLIDHAEERIKVSPTQQQEQDQNLRHAARSCGKIEIEIKLLKDALTVQRVEHEKTVYKLNEELNSCRRSIDRRGEQIRNDIERIVNESEAKMVEIYKDSVCKQELLRSEIKVSETSLNNSRRNNILMEKDLGDKRCKVETQLQDCLAKYDADIGGRHRDMENFAEEFRLLNSQRKMLENDVMIDLRNLHDDLQREKAEALQKILNEQVERFVRNRAARIIQKAWRAFWERHCAKKKKKSRKK